MATTMARLAGQDPAHRGPTLVVAAQFLDIRVKVTMVVIISSLVRVISNKIISQYIRVIQNNLTVINIMFLQLVFANMIIRFINAPSILWSHRYPSTYCGQNIQ